MAKFNDSEIVGLSLDDAEALAKKNGLRLRPIRIDGESLCVTCDYRTDRINVVVENDKVTSVKGRG